LRELIGDYHRAVSKTVGRFDGFVAKYMGDARSKSEAEVRRPKAGGLIGRRKLEGQKESGAGRQNEGASWREVRRWAGGWQAARVARLIERRA